VKSSEPTYEKDRRLRIEDRRSRIERLHSILYLRSSIFFLGGSGGFRRLHPPYPFLVRRFSSDPLFLSFLLLDDPLPILCQDVADAA